MAALLCAWALSVGVAHAQAPAEEAFTRGVAHTREGRWADAATEFERAADLDPRPSVLFNLAVALDRLKQHRAAYDAAERFLTVSSPGTHERARRQAHVVRERALAHLARLVVVVEPEHAQLALDQQPLELPEGGQPLLVEPGVHQLVAQATGHGAVHLELLLEPGEQVQRNIQLPAALPAPAARLPPTPSRPEPVAAGDRPPPRWSRRLIVASSVLVVGAGAGLGIAVADKRATESALGISYDDVSRRHRRAYPLSLGSVVVGAVGIVGLSIGLVGRYSFSREGMTLSLAPTVGVRTRARRRAGGWL